MSNYPYKHLLTIMLLSLTVMQLWGGSPVVQLDFDYPERGLSGNNIAIWGSHGRYFNQKEGKWRWQRCHLHQTIEDLYTSTYVIDLIAPMLENAGAYVMMPRERDTSSFEAIVDASLPPSGNFSIKGPSNWNIAEGVKGFSMPSAPLSDGQNPFEAGTLIEAKTTTSKADESLACYNADIAQGGTYTIYVSYATLPSSSPAVLYTVNSLRGSEQFLVDQRMGGSTWMRLGEFPLAAGVQNRPIVEVSNLADPANAGKIVTTDAIKIGGGMGNVARRKAGRNATATVSGLPRWAEGSRYYLQWAGIPADVYSISEGKDDYEDDYKSRPLWVNYLAGGSPKLPGKKGLNIPVDISLAIHTDAGNEVDEYVGTLGIYCTDSGRRLGDGSRRTTNKDLAQTVVNSLVDDIRALYDPDWNLRGIRDKKYAEARLVDVPSLLIEMLSHQNFDDMLLGQNPKFRFDVARAIYKGLLKYQAGKEKRPYTVQPLPVNSFEIDSRGHGNYTLRWKPTPDPLEPTAVATSYIIELREDAGGAFSRIGETTSTSFNFEAPEGRLCSLRVIAVNDGGRSFPSESLALEYFDNGLPEVLVINGFTRLSPPEWFATAEEAGFIDSQDYGASYVRNVGYSGEQYDFIRSHPWKDDVRDPGYGASRNSCDGTPVAGNTFDYPALHGRAIASARFSFTSTSLDAYLDHPGRFHQKIIDLILGKQREFQMMRNENSTRFKALPANLQQALQAHASKGGSLIISGENIVSDVILNPYSGDDVRDADTRFLKSVLAVDTIATTATGSNRLTMPAAWYNLHCPVSATFADKPNPQVFAVNAAYPLTPAGSEVIMTFADGSPAATYARNNHGRTVTIAVPLETVTDSDALNNLLGGMLMLVNPEKLPRTGKAVRRVAIPANLHINTAPFTISNPQIERPVLPPPSLDHLRFDPSTEEDSFSDGDSVIKDLTGRSPSNETTSGETELTNNEPSYFD